MEDSSKTETEFSIQTLFSAIKNQDTGLGTRLADAQLKLSNLKRQISVSSKKNFNLEKDISNLDNKIALLIKNRISLEEAMQTSADVSQLINQRQTKLSNKKQNENYGALFHILRHDTRYVGKLARAVTLGEIDNLLQTVMFTLYGNQYEETEEHMLLTMFAQVLQEDFATATNVNALLRANTALTRMMTTYTRRGPGQQYLKKALTPPLEEITREDKMDLEINPAKVYEYLINEEETRTGKPTTKERKVEPDVAAQDPSVQALVKERTVMLKKICFDFLNSILSTLDVVPYGIRWICKQIRHLAITQFPDITRAQTVGLIGGFFLLRFVNPAIVTPQAFMLVEAKLSPETRRNLTLLAKVLQNLANNTKFGGHKEFFMEPMNDFLDEAGARMNTFLEALCNVDDLDSHMQMDRYLTLAKHSDTTINITLNEMYFIHSLLLLHLDSFGIDDTAQVRALLADLGPAPAQLPRADNSNVELVLRNPNAQESENLKPDQLLSETKYLLFTVLKAMPRLETQSSDMRSVLREIHQYATKQAKDEELTDRIKKIIANCNQLVDENVLKVDDNYARLRKETFEEVINYKLRIKRIEEDMTALQKVLDALHEHNNFLQGQHEAYQEYLENTRKSSAVSSSGRKAGKAATKDSKKAKGGRAGSIGAIPFTPKGPFKFSHALLQRDGLITESGAPEDRRSNIFFEFSSDSPGIYDVKVSYRTKVISSITLRLDDLLEQQSSGELIMETDFLKLNVNLLLHLLNKNFNNT